MIYSDLFAMFPDDIMDIINEYANTPVKPSPIKTYKEMLDDLVLFQKRDVWGIMMRCIRAIRGDNNNFIRHFTGFCNIHPVIDI